MGARPSNHKSNDGHLNILPCNFRLFSTAANSDTPISKKPKTSSYMQSSPLHSRSSASSRVNRYPKPVNPIQRAVHAPCRASRLSFCSSSSSSPESRLDSSSPESRGKKDEEVIECDPMGNILFDRLKQLKESVIKRFRYVKPDEEVIDVDRYLEKDKKLKESAIGGLSYLKKDEEVIDVDRYLKKDEEVIDVDRYLKKDKKLKESSYLKKDEEVIDVDRVVDRGYVSGNSSGEEVMEVFYEGRQWRSQKEKGKVVDVDHCSDLMNANLMEERIELLSLYQKWDGPVHKKLLEHAEKRDPKLKSLGSDIEINEKEWAALQLLRPASAKKPQHKDVLHHALGEAFVPLTEEEQAEIFLAFSKSSRRKVLATHEDSNIEITGEHLQCLRPGAWLNDEVINLYLELLKEREKREPKKFLKCHFFNTFFYKKLIGGRNGYDFKSVKRWTSQRKLGYCLLECDRIFVPIHKEIHWCLAVINKMDEKFQYLDSLKGIDTQVLQVLARYFVDEVKDKSGKDIDVHSWKQEIVEDLPEQKNGWDCGVFMIKYADFYSRGLGLHFKQEHMPYFRQRTAKEILRLKAE